MVNTRRTRQRSEAHLSRELALCNSHFVKQRADSNVGAALKECLKILYRTALAPDFVPYKFNSVLLGFSFLIQSSVLTEERFSNTSEENITYMQCHPYKNVQCVHRKPLNNQHAVTFCEFTRLPDYFLGLMN